MNIQEASDLSGLPPATIRFYERTGVVPSPPRRANGYRSYTLEHVAVLRLAKGLRQMGVSLSEAAPVLSMVHSGKRGEVRRDLTGVLLAALAETESQLKELTLVREHLTHLVAGLEKMQPGESNVPGVRPCRCVELVSHELEGAATHA
jgi:MerR family copper efflux transcriptional regulator